MIVSYTHEDDRVEEYSTDDLSAIESAEVERVTGMEWDTVEEALKGGRATAMRAVIWVFRKRQTAGLRFNDFDLAQWKRRLKARLERHEVLDILQATQLDPADDEAAMDAKLQAMARYVRVFAHNPADVDWALDEMAPKAQPGPGLPAEEPLPTSADQPAVSETSSTSTGL